MTAKDTPSADQSAPEPKSAAEETEKSPLNGEQAQTQRPGQTEQKPSTSSRRRLWVLLGTLLAVVLVAVLVGVSYWGKTEKTDAAPVVSATSNLGGEGTPNSEPTPEATISSPAAQPTKASPSSSKELEVPEPDKETGRKVIHAAPGNLEAQMDPQARKDYGIKDPNQVLPAGTKMEIDEKTWTKVEENLVMVKTTITRPGEKPQVYSVMLGREKPNAPWKILGTLDYAEDGTVLGTEQ